MPTHAGYRPQAGKLEWDSPSPARFLSSGAHVDVFVLLARGILLAGLRSPLRLAGRRPSPILRWTIALARNPLESIDRRQSTPRDRGWAVC
jgi:hypothetical protein